MMALSCSRVLKQLVASSAARSVGVVPLRHPPAVTTHRRGLTSTARAKAFISDAWERFSPMTMGRELLNSTSHTIWIEGRLNDASLGKSLKFSIDIPGNKKITYTDDGNLLVSVYFGLEALGKNQKIIKDEYYCSYDAYWDASLGDKRTDLIIKGSAKKYNIRGRYSAKLDLPTPTLEAGNNHNIYWKPFEVYSKGGDVLVYLRKVKEET